MKILNVVGVYGESPPSISIWRLCILLYVYMLLTAFWREVGLFAVR